MAASWVTFGLLFTPTSGHTAVKVHKTYPVLDFIWLGSQPVYQDVGIISSLHFLKVAQKMVKAVLFLS